MSAGSSQKSSLPKHLALLIGLSLALRVGFVLSTAGTVPFADMEEYDRAARHLVEQGRLPPDAFRPPLYPLLLAGAYRLFGHDLQAARYVQALLGAVLAVTVYFCGLSVSTEAVAFKAGLLCSFYPTLIIYANLLMTENLFLPIVALAFYLSVTALRGEKPWLWCASGFLWGLATLTREVTLGLPLLLAVFGFYCRGKAFLGNAFLLVAAFALALSPWTVRNYRLYGKLIPVSTSGGYNFLIGNNPQARGQLIIEDLPELWERYWGAAENDYQRHALGYRHGARFIIRHPLRFSTLAVRKIGYLYGPEGRELIWAYTQGYYGRVSKSVLMFFIWSVGLFYPLLGLLAFFGAVAWWLDLQTSSEETSSQAKSRPALLLIFLVIAYFTVVHAVSFGESRFHLPLVCLFTVLASKGLCSFPLPLKCCRRSRKPAILLSLLLFLFCLNYLVQVRSSWEKLGVMLSALGHESRLAY